MRACSSTPPKQNQDFVKERICVTNTGKQLCSPNEPFVVVLENRFFFKNEISPFEVDFEICNFVDLFYAQTYTLTKIQEVKKHNRTPLILSSPPLRITRGSLTFLYILY